MSGGSPWQEVAIAQGVADIHNQTPKGAASSPGDSKAVSGLGEKLSAQRFGELLEEHYRTVWYIAAAILNDRTQAHDVVQEAATIALTKLGEFDPRTSFAAWMGQIVRFVALNESRRRARQRTTGVSPEVLGKGPGGAGNVEGTLDGRMQRALEGLEETARACLVLRAVQGLSYAEIATALGVPEGTAMSHVHRARLAIRDRLGGGEGSA